MHRNRAVIFTLWFCGFVTKIVDTYSVAGSFLPILTHGQSQQIRSGAIITDKHQNRSQYWLLEKKTQFYGNVFVILMVSKTKIPGTNDNQVSSNILVSFTSSNCQQDGHNYESPRTSSRTARNAWRLGLSPAFLWFRCKYFPGLAGQFFVMDEVVVIGTQ